MYENSEKSLGLQGVFGKFERVEAKDLETHYSKEIESKEISIEEGE